MDIFVLKMEILVVLSLLISLYRHNTPSIIHDKRFEEITNVLLLIAFSVIIATRPNEVPDTKGYVAIFNMVKENEHYGFDILGEMFTVEYAFLYLMKYFKCLFGENFQFFSFLLCFASASIFLYSLRDILKLERVAKVDFAILFCCYISYYGIYYNGIAIRQGLCFSFGMLAFRFILKKKYFYGVFSLFCAFLLHRMSVLYIPLFALYFFLKNRNFKVKSYVLLWILLGLYLFLNSSSFFQDLFFNIVYFVLNKIHLTQYIGWLIDYTKDGFMYTGTNVLIWLYAGIMLYFILSNDSLKKLINIYLIGLVLSILFIMMTGSCRIYDYFTIFSVMIFATAYSPWTYSESLRKEKIIVSNNLNNIMVIAYLLMNVLLIRHVLGM